jgi:hypothetical protein
VRQIEVRTFEKVQNAVKLRIAGLEHAPTAHIAGQNARILDSDQAFASEVARPLN